MAGFHREGLTEKVNLSNDMNEAGERSGAGGEHPGRNGRLWVGVMLCQQWWRGCQSG